MYYRVCMSIPLCALFIYTHTHIHIKIYSDVLSSCHTFFGPTMLQCSFQSVYMLPRSTTLECLKNSVYTIAIQSSLIEVANSDNETNSA